jgi:predicted GNAT superfamily acetyltransferase
MTACEALYAEVMGLRPEDGSINPRLLIALQHNAGYVIGAFLHGQAVGFVYSFLGCDRSAPDAMRLYQYSQLAVVSQPLQGRGIGRLLKLAQRDRCLADGIDRMRWAYDPLRTRNAHFNLDVLGGRVIRIVPEMYGHSGFGAYAGDATDRFIIDWPLSVDPEHQIRRAIPTQSWSVGVCAEDEEDLLIAVPAHWDKLRAQLGNQAAANLRGELRRAFASALDSNRMGISCQPVDAECSVYRFAPSSQSQDQQ